MKLKSKSILISSMAALMGTAALYQGPVVRSYKLTTPKWRRNVCLRFAVAADLHSVPFGDKQDKLLNVLQMLAPDYILMPGDMVDENRPPVHARDFLQGAALIAPCYYVPGNHEYRSRCMPAILRMVERCGVTPLIDRYLHLNTAAGSLVLAGCEDPEKSKYDTRYRSIDAMRTAFQTIPQEDAYTILLAHRPERYPVYHSFGFDLVVSGHAHGGQARIPGLLNGLYAPGQGILPWRAGGCYDSKGTAHIVSRGLAVYTGIPRVFNPPEIVCIQITGIR